MARHRITLALVSSVLAGSAAAQDGMEVQRCVWGCLAAFGPNTNPAYHQCVANRCAAPAALPGVPAGPGDWGDIGGLIQGTIGEPLIEGSNFWLPDNADPMRARQAVVFHYFMPPGGGNAMGLKTALFRKTGEGFVLAGMIEGLFGNQPRDVRYLADRVEITTTTLGPNDARCCPTQVAVWSVDLGTRAVARIR